MAATVVRQIVAKLIGQDANYSSTLDKAKKKNREFEMSTRRSKEELKKFQRQSRSTRDTSFSLSRTLGALGVSIGGLEVLRRSIITFKDFNAEMVKSTSIMNASTAQIERMRLAALDLEGAAQAPKELAGAYFFLASAGLDAEQSIKALPRVTKFATAGAFDLSTATDLLTDAQSALGLSSKNATENLKNMTRVADVLVKSNTLANGTVREFSESLTNEAGAALKGVNKSIEEGVAVLAAYADQGEKGRRAGSNLARIMRILSESAIKYEKDHKKLNFQVFDSEGKMRNLGKIIGNLETILDGLSDKAKAATLKQLGFNTEVQNAIKPLIGTSEKIAEYQTALENAGGTTDKVAKEQMKSLDNILKETKNSISALTIELTSKLEPFLKASAKEAGRLAKNLKDISRESSTGKTQGRVAGSGQETTGLDVFGVSGFVRDFISSQKDLQRARLDNIIARSRGREVSENAELVQTIKAVLGDENAQNRSQAVRNQAAKREQLAELRIKQAEERVEQEKRQALLDRQRPGKILDAFKSSLTPNLEFGALGRLPSILEQSQGAISANLLRAGAQLTPDREKGSKSLVSIADSLSNIFQIISQSADKAIFLERVGAKGR